MDNRFELVFDKSMTCIAGFEYGREIFEIIYLRRG